MLLKKKRSDNYYAGFNYIVHKDGKELLDKYEHFYEHNIFAVYSKLRIYLHLCGKKEECKLDYCKNKHLSSWKVSIMTPIKWIPSKNDGSILQILNEPFVTVRNIRNHTGLAPFRHNNPDEEVRFIHLRCDNCGKNIRKYSRH